MLSMRMFPTIYTFESSAPSLLAILLLLNPAVKRMSERPSMTRRLISFGMVISKDRVPAAMCASVMACFLVTMAAAIVEAKSSTTMTISVGFACKYCSNLDITCPVSSFRFSHSTPRQTSGRRMERLANSPSSSVGSSARPA